MLLIITRLVLLDDLHHLSHVQADLRALLLLVVGDGYILIQDKPVCSTGVSCCRIQRSHRYITALRLYYASPTPPQTASQ